MEQGRLQELDVGYGAFGDDGVDPLAAMLERNRSLSMLDVSGWSDMHGLQVLDLDQACEQQLPTPPGLLPDIAVGPRRRQNEPNPLG